MGYNFKRLFFFLFFSLYVSVALCFETLIKGVGICCVLEREFAVVKRENIGGLATEFISGERGEVDNWKEQLGQSPNANTIPIEGYFCDFEYKKTNCAYICSKFHQIIRNSLI